MKRILLFIITSLTLIACENNSQKKAERLLQEAQTHLDQGRLDAARTAVDSLRKTYPNIVAARKGALRIHQEIELKIAQEELLLADSLLQKANKNLEAFQKQVDDNKTALKATSEELTQLTKMRIYRDSIRTQFETLGAKIRYIRQKQKETRP